MEHHTTTTKIRKEISMSVLHDNIKYVCKKNGINIRDIEKPMKAGFISRYERRNGIMNLPIWVFVKISNNCNVSIDDLIYKDLKGEAELDAIRSEIKRLKEKEAELTGNAERR